MQISANLCSTGLSAIKAGQAQLSHAAQAIASTPAESTATTLDITDITKQLIQLEQAKQSSQFGAKVLSSADQALGTLIDIQA